MRTHRLTLLAIFAGVLLVAGEQTVFQADFRTPDSLKAWRAVTYPVGATFACQDGTLTVTHRHAKRQGGFIEIPVPLIKKGRLDFDVTVPATGHGIGLTLDLYNISTFWHDGCKDWRLYFAEPNANRLPYYLIEPVGHHRIATIPKDKTLHYRIRFDEALDLVEFYVDNMDDPAATRYDVSVFGHAFYQQSLLRLGSFGYVPAVYSTTISNLILTEETADQDNGSSERTLHLGFDGMTSRHHRLEELLPKGFRRYVWDNPGHNPTNTNTSTYRNLPGFDTVAHAQTIIFNDAPNVPVPLQKMMLKAVEDGANMFFLGGLCTLNKGEFHDTPLGKALPVNVENPWAMAGSDEKPLPITPSTGVTWPSVDGGPGVCYYYLDLPPLEDAEVLLRAGQDGPPLLVRKKIGAGSITVLLATACGPDTPNSFWNTHLVKQIVQQ